MINLIVQCWHIADPLISLSLSIYFLEHLTAPLRRIENDFE
jgi:hypothetical protein